MTIARLGASFRDPHGFLYERDGVLLRQVNAIGQNDYAAARDSGVLAALMADGWLVGHAERPLKERASDEAVAVLAPERLPFISYPWEWTFGQLRAAALLTIRLQRRLLTHGLTLRDASAFNIQWRGSQPVLVDTLSIGLRAAGHPWLAYRQFCRHFLAPLSLMARVDVRLRDLWKEHLDGVPLDLTSRLLPTRTWLAPWALIHLHLHARSERRYAGRSVGRSARTISNRGLEGMVDHLERAVERLVWMPPATEWGDYEATHRYEQEAREAKLRVVGEALRRVRPSTVWDFGANTGRFSQLADAEGAYTVALDADVGAVERHFEHLYATGNRRVLPLWSDLRNPGAAAGWAHEERLSLLDRGPADMVLALAVVHHLAIGNNLPLPAIARFLARAARVVLVEWVPKDDFQVRRLLDQREDIFPSYTREAWERALAQHLRITATHALPASGRVLYIAERI